MFCSQDKPPVPPKQLPPQKQFSEEKLPKIIVCGSGADDNVPKIIVCEPMKDCDTQPFPETKIPDKVMHVTKCFYVMF